MPVQPHFETLTIKSYKSYSFFKHASFIVCLKKYSLFKVNQQIICDNAITA